MQTPICFPNLGTEVLCPCFLAGSYGEAMFLINPYMHHFTTPLTLWTTLLSSMRFIYWNKASTVAFLLEIEPLLKVNEYKSISPHSTCFSSFIV